MSTHSRTTRVIAGTILVLVGVVGALVSGRAGANFFGDVGQFLANSFTTSVPGSPPSPATPQAGVELYKPAENYESAVVAAVDTAAPSVVSIVITKDLPVIEQCPYDPFGDIPPEFRDFFGGGFGGNFTQPCQKGTKTQEVGGGSGFIVSADGLIVTNKHVVADTKAAYTVLTNDGKKFDATVVARDSAQDLAVLKIGTSGLKPVALGDSDTVKLGQTAIAIGNSLGEFRNTVSVGVISGLARTITASGASIGSETLQGVIQTDAAINPGNSGGPLLNLRGEVIGINTAVASGAQNVGFAIPINQAKRAIASVKQSGRIITPYLGVRYMNITEELAKKQKLTVVAGALVRGTEDGPGVLPGSPAARGGVQAEDIITEVGGKKITPDQPLGSLIQRYNVGDTLTLTVRRGGQTITLSVTLSERPAGT
ncbi:MAG: trypsin-like peptidase domain-containing protein [bacterium]|nr:trypsin-like peptidase domain-containing protein [bacterium]